MGAISKFMFFNSIPPVHYVREYKDASVYAADDVDDWDADLPNTDAVTFDHHIVMRTKKLCYDKATLSHEYKHITRIQQEGGELSFRPKLLFHMVCAWVATGDTTNTKYEQEASLAEKI